MDESNFDRLLERYVTGQVTPEEQIKIEAWLEVRKTRKEEKTSLTETEQDVLFSKITAKINNEKEIRALRPIEATRQSRTRWTLGIAASIALLVTIGVLFNSIWSDPNPQTASTEKLILEDGSIVWLRGESKFSYSNAPDGSRHGILDGEGLFEIAKDPNRPFHIIHNDFTITVLGTSFHLRAIHDSLDLKVLTGKVRVTTGSDSAGVVIERLQTMTLNGTKSERASLNTESIATLVEGTQYAMNFTNTDMRSVAKRLSAKFNVEFKFSNEQLGNCVVTADFTDRSLESTTSMLADALNAKFIKDGNTIHVDGVGCE